MDKIFSVVKNALASTGIDLGELLKGQKQKDRDLQIALEKEYSKQFEQELTDRQSARALQVSALNQKDNFSKRFIYVLSLGIFAVLAFLVTAPFYIEFPEANDTLVNRAFDFVANLSLMVFGFFFGTKLKK